MSSIRQKFRLGFHRDFGAISNFWDQKWGLHFASVIARIGSCSFYETFSVSHNKSTLFMATFLIFGRKKVINFAADLDTFSSLMPLFRKKRDENPWRARIEHIVKTWWGKNLMPCFSLTSSENSVGALWSRIFSLFFGLPFCTQKFSVIEC